jgi:hypothetical protein
MSVTCHKRAKFGGNECKMFVKSGKRKDLIDTRKNNKCKRDGRTISEDRIEGIWLEILVV